MGRMSKVAKEFKEKTGYTPVELVRHIRRQMAKEGYPEKLFKRKEAS